MNIIFTGPPLAGKGTQAHLLGKKLNLPAFSIGALLREHAKDGYEKYAMQGKNLPIELKFKYLKEKLDASKNGFILENFPASSDDLEVFVEYLAQNKLKVDRVFVLEISQAEAEKRSLERNRADDTEEIVKARLLLQAKDREPVIKYFEKLGVLRKINGEGTVEEVEKRVLKNL